MMFTRRRELEALHNRVESLHERMRYLEYKSEISVPDPVPGLWPERSFSLSTADAVAKLLDHLGLRIEVIPAGLNRYVLKPRSDD